MHILGPGTRISHWRWRLRLAPKPLSRWAWCTPQYENHWRPVDVFSFACTLESITWLYKAFKWGPQSRPMTSGHGLKSAPVGFLKIILLKCNWCTGFQGGASGKEPASRCRRHKRCGFDTWVGKIPGRRAWRATAHGVTKSRTRLSN